jgi:DNA repair exonuclease SbcCD ATPase subunit
MKKVKLQSLHIVNFKGIKDLSITFQDETFIYGRNGSGKTTISDAFLWLLFGKNSEDKKDFSIKPLDGQNNIIPKTENQVEGSFLVDGQNIVLRRIHREKWVKSKGELEATFTGNETLFFWNEVPCQAGEYQKKVSELINEQLFKLITSPTAFNDLDWKERRRIITGIVGEVSDNDIAASKKEFMNLMMELSGKSLEDYRKEITAKKKKLKDELSLIPARIDELHKSLPAAPDTAMIQIDINNMDIEIKKCNDQIKDASKASEQFFQEKSKRNERIGEIRQQLFNITEAEKTTIRSTHSDALTNRQSLEREIKNIELDVADSQRTKNQLVSKSAMLDGDILRLRGEWGTVNAKTLTFNEAEFCCPTCKRAYEDSDIESKQAEMTENFNVAKSKQLAEISAQGKQKNTEKSAIQPQIVELDEFIALKSEIIEAKQKELSSIVPVPDDYEINLQAQKKATVNEDYKALTGELDKLNQVNDLPFTESNNNLKIEAERKEFELKRDELNMKLNNQAVIDRTNNRIQQLNDEARSFSQQVATLEKSEFIILAFEKAKIDLIEEKVNQRFKLVQFKMFKQNINGGTEPCCEILCNGVPFSDANTASQINAGIEIINILCENYQVSAPIFIDGRESITEIILTDSQIINMVVSPEHETLTVK